MSQDKVCTSCGHEGKPIPQAKDSFIVDAAIWFYTIFLVSMSQLFPLLLIPLAWTVYHIARFNTVKCPACNNLDMVSKKSRRGKAFLANPNPVSIIYKAENN